MSDEQVVQQPETQPEPAQQDLPFSLDQARQALMADDVSLEFTDDGDWELSVASGESEEPEATAEEAEPEPESDSKDTRPARTHDWETRYKAAQAWGTRLSQEKAEMASRLDRMEGMLQAITGGADPREAEPELPDFDPQVSAYIERAINQGIEQYMAPIIQFQKQLQPVITDHQVQSELRQVMTKHPDFPAYAEKVYQLFERLPNSNLTYEEAYEVVKTFGGVEQPALASADPQQTAPPQAKPAAPTAPQLTKEQILARANRVATETSQSNDDVFAPKRNVNSIFDAMNAALEEM